MSEQNPDQWNTHILMDYAVTLQRSGDPDSGDGLVDNLLARVQQQMAAGVLIEDWFELRFFAAALHALRDEKRQALDFLREDANNGGISSVTALKIWPHFDKLRDEPEFQALIDEQHAANIEWQRRLQAQGLLLTPAEVLALEEFEFDPFARSE